MNRRQTILTMIESADGLGGKQQAMQCDYDLLLLDLGLPGLSGLEILRSVRKLRPSQPTAIEQILFNLVDNACKYAQSSTDNRILFSICKPAPLEALTLAAKTMG